MSDARIRREQRSETERKIDLFQKNMCLALSKLSKTPEGLLALRFILRESSFLANLTYETKEGVNKDVLLANEAKRRMYLSLRAYMDRDTVIRVELPDEVKNEGGNNA